MRKMIWQRISDAVSAQGPGKKDVEQLKKHYNDIKRFAKAKLAREKNSARATGGGPAYVADLNNYKQKLVQCLGPEIITVITDDCDSDLRATPTPQPQPGRSTNEAPSTSRSSGAAQQFEIHTPENQDEQVETQASPPQETGDVNIANPPAVGLSADVGLTEMLSFARQYREDHREMQNVININIECLAAISEKNIEIEKEKVEIERQKLNHQRGMFQWQRQMDEEKKLANK
ncbi:myb-related transcription factor, partner of profilin-like isoform X2 [Bombina bombina]|nr:myb-related transcription factor, partner of profilin-like isoform X2 [Bombina bombina]